VLLHAARCVLERTHLLVVEVRRAEKQPCAHQPAIVTGSFEDRHALDDQLLEGAHRPIGAKRGFVPGDLDLRAGREHVRAVGGRQAQGLLERAGRSGVIAGGAEPRPELDEDGGATRVRRQQPGRTSQKRDRGDVDGLCGPDPRPGEPAACRLCEPRQLRILGVQLGAIVVRLLEMPPD
jgi:hypothetical protein